MHAKTPYVATEASEDNDVHEELKVGVNDNMSSFPVVDSLTCCYPDCIFVNMTTSPPLVVCQGICGKKGRFHHACNVNQLESKGIDAKLHKICYSSVCTQYSDV